MASQIRFRSSSLAKLGLSMIALIPGLQSHLTFSASRHPGIFRNRIQLNLGLETSPNSPEFWTKILIVAFLVILGGVFAGLTLGLMGLDAVNLQVLEVSGTPYERSQAGKVLKLLNRGKHWVLVTLLLSNVIVNETLPIFIDSIFGGGWFAIVASTALIVIFGEIIPQSLCVRYGLIIGSKCTYFVLALMYIMYPVAYPIAILLDHVLGEDNGTVYQKPQLKTFVSLHGTLGDATERLNADEITIIGSVLDLNEKPVEQVMTPMEDVYVLSADHNLNEETVDEIEAAGYSRIPIHQPNNPTNFIGMLLVKSLISYDPEDCLPVSAFSLSPLPETSPDTSCLDILNFFQEGRSHMVLVSNRPGENGGALGVITLEDVIEELIGEEIIDETDVFVNVHHKIRVLRTPTTNRKLVPLRQSRTVSKERKSLIPAVSSAVAQGKVKVKETNAELLRRPLENGSGNEYNTISKSAGADNKNKKAITKSSSTEQNVRDNESKNDERRPLLK